MRTLRKKISLILIFVLLANLLLPVMGFAAEANNSVIPDELTNKSSEQILLSPDTTSWGNQINTQESNTNSQSNNNNEEAIANKILENQQNINENTIEGQAAWVAGLYFIPGIGQVAILTTGVIVVGGTTYYAGSLIYNKVKDYLANAEKKPVDVSDKDSWTKVGSESDLLKKANGKKGKTTKGTDGTIKTDVLDKTTGKKIGEIHKNQPEKIRKNGKDVYTGRKYPDHYHDYANNMGKGSGHHWYWK